MNTVYLSNGTRTSVRLAILPTASGFEVVSELRVNGKHPVTRAIDVFRTRPLAVAAVKTEAARVATALMMDELP